jgi:hypothetical protein
MSIIGIVGFLGGSYLRAPMAIHMNTNASGYHNAHARMINPIATPHVCPLFGNFN